MNFYFTTLKIKSFKYLIVIFIFASLDNLYGQSTTKSPYSKYGIGVLRPSGFAQNFAMGGLSIANRSLLNINVSNPASYTSLALTTFEIAGMWNSTWLKDETQTQYLNNGYINYLSFAFPVINKKWGASFGLLPYSSVGYKYNYTIPDPLVGDIEYYYEGTGGINKAYIGNAFSMKMDSTIDLSVGFNASYLFGEFYYDEKYVFSDIPNAYNIWKYHRKNTGGFAFDFGLQLTKQLNDKKSITLGATYALGNDLNTNQSTLIQSFTGTVNNGLIKDTTLNEKNINDTISIPSTYSVGIVFNNLEKLTIGFDFKLTDWSSNKTSNTLYSIKNTFNTAVGVEYIPDAKAFNHYLKMVKYRAGIRYGTYYVAINNQDITEYAISFGASLPFKRTFSTVNFGIEYGNKGITNNNLFKEEFININFGVTINDRWFIKRKYD
ncbi:MAG: membrane protein [Vicingaceae bacterium]